SVLLGIGIIMVGLRPASELPRVSRLPPGSDKVLHFAAYASLGACVFRSIYPRNPRRPPAGIPLPWLPAMLLPSLVGLLDEVLQHYTARGRAGDPADWVADTFGGVFVCMLGLYFRRHAKETAIDGHFSRT